LAGRQSKRNNVPADNAETYYKSRVVPAAGLHAAGASASL